MSEECDTSTENGHNFCMIPFTGAYNPNIIVAGGIDIGEKIKIPRGVPGCLGIGIPNIFDIICRKLTKNPNNIIKKAIISLIDNFCFK